MSGQAMLITDLDWVVIMLDPDDGDWSPWNVTAPDVASAIAKAKTRWLRWSEGEDGWDQDDEDVAEPDGLDGMVLKAYRGSWIGDRVL